MQEVIPVLDDAVVVYGLVLLTTALMMVAARPRHWFRKGTPYPESD